MALKLSAAGIARATNASHAHAETVADLHQLSAVSAISVIGVCLSLMVLTFADRGEWLITIANGF